MSRSEIELPALNVMALARACARYPRSTYPDLLASAATHGTGDASALRALAYALPPVAGEPGDEGEQPAVDITALNARLVAGAALVQAGMLPHDGTLEDVVRLLDLAHRLRGPRDLPAVFTDLWLDALYLSGQSQRFPLPREHDVESAHWRVTVDELNPYLAARTSGALAASHEAWLTQLSRVFTEYGLSPLHLRVGDEAPLRRLEAVSRPADGAGRVSVVIPAFEPEDGPPFALMSILRQTWSDLEVVLCDDGSGPRGRETLTRWARMDPRVRLVRSEVNGGAYTARNLGLAHATGEFVTFQDIDDWSHPERVARQVSALRADAAAVGTVSRMVRVDEQLALTVLGYAAIGTNASSLLFRREQVLSRLGGFDAVRRAGDNEFLGRLLAVFGPHAVRYQPEVLAVVGRTDDSLSRTDLRLLYRHPARTHYRACYRRWHERIEAGQAEAYLPHAQRIPVPARGRVSGVERPDVQCTVAVLASSSRNSPTSADLAAELSAVAGTGRTVGVVEFPAPFDLSVPQRPTAGGVADLVNAADVAWLTPDDRFAADMAVVRDPAALCHLADVMSGASVTQAVLVADYHPAHHYDPVQVETALTRARVPLVRWLPATDGIAAELRAAVGADRVLPPRLWGVATPTAGDRPRSPTPVRVGMTPPSTSLATRDLLAWARTGLPLGAHVEVWCPTRQPAITRRLGRTVHTPGPPRLPMLDFLRQVSHLVLPPTPGRGPHLHRDAVHALQQGCVLLLDATYRPHFGDAALYTDDRSAQDWVDLHTARPALFVEQQQRAQAFLERHLSATALQATVAGLLSPRARG